MIGRTGAQITLEIGKDTAWFHEKLAEGMRWRLIVLPQAVCAAADWAGEFAMIDAHYPEVAGKLTRRRTAVTDPALARSIDPAMVNATVNEDAEHPAHLSTVRYLACPATAHNARMFSWHALGLNQHFVGAGWATDPLTAERVEEYLTGNVPLATAAGHQLIDLNVAA